MDKVICDVCGMDYSATSAQCPICGCARSDSGQTSAGNTVQTEDAAYSPTKGGRFSKSNVRKRLKAAQIQPVPVEIPSRPEKVQEPEEDDYEESYEEDEVDEEPASNRGLIVIVALLLLAIIAVSCYIVIQFGIFDKKPSADPNGTTGSNQSTTAPANPDENRIPCTGLTVMDTDIVLGGQITTVQLSFSSEPIDTTDVVSFESSDTAIATVDQQGRVTAVGNGEATITITCGEFVKTCKVTCKLGGDEPDQPIVPDEPMPNLQMRSEYNDVSFPAKGYQWRAYKETADFGADEAAKFTWKMDDESIATVANGIITTVAPGRTTLRVFYGDEQVGYCLIRCNWTEAEPTPPENPDDPDDPQDPVTPAQGYFLKINGVTHPFKYNNQDNSADVTINLNSNVKSFKLTIVNENAAIMNDVVWTISDESICSVSNNTVKGLAEGTCRITAEYQGISFFVFVRCNG